MSAGFTHILVPMDHSPASQAALVCAKQIAERFASRLSLLHVITDPRATGTWTPDVYVPAIPEVRDRFLREARQRLAEAVTDDERARLHVTVDAQVGGVAEIIRDVAREQAVDLIVMGTHGRRGIAHLLLGSIAERIVREAPCPVLTTHAEHVSTKREEAAQAASA